MDETAIIRSITDTFAGVEAFIGSEEAGSPEIAWGDAFFIYDPARDLPTAHRFPFATLVTKDYPGFDSDSNLDRPGVCRLNIGVGKDTFRALFGQQQNPADAASYDFTALNRLMPHPIYAPQSWVCILNPSDATFQAEVQPLLAEAYAIAVKRLAR